MRQNYSQIYKTLGRYPQGYEPKQCPEDVLHIWHMYNRLAPHGPLTYTELKNWSELTSTTLAPYEAEALIALDRTYWSTINGG